MTVEVNDLVLAALNVVLNVTTIMAIVLHHVWEMHHTSTDATSFKQPPER